MAIGQFTGLIRQATVLPHRGPPPLPDQDTTTRLAVKDTMLRCQVDQVALRCDGSQLIPPRAHVFGMCLGETSVRRHETVIGVDNPAPRPIAIGQAFRSILKFRDDTLPGGDSATVTTANWRGRRPPPRQKRLTPKLRYTARRCPGAGGCRHPAGFSSSAGTCPHRPSRKPHRSRRSPASGTPRTAWGHS